MGYYKYENIEISRPHLEGFGWSNAEKITLNKKQFIEYLRIHEKAHRIMLLRIQKALAELMR